MDHLWTLVRPKNFCTHDSTDTTFEENSNSTTVVFDIKWLSDVKNMGHKQIKKI